MYVDPWAFTFAGQFWTEFTIGSHKRHTLSKYDVQLSPDSHETGVLEEHERIPIGYLTNMCMPFQLARNMCSVFAESEMVEWEVEASSLDGKWLDANSECVGPCRAPRIRRTGESSAKEFFETYMDRFADFGKDFTDLFCRDGRTISRGVVLGYQNDAGERDR